MKIGTLTFHGSHNYGSVLQAYALSKQLKLMGNDVDIINLRPQSQKDAYPKIPIANNFVYKIYYKIIQGSLNKRYDNFERFINDILPTTKMEYASTEELKNADFNYDAYICGGDQIWNPACQDFETAYYLQFLDENDSAKKISYSPSLGKTKFDEKTLKNISCWVSKFDYISVREKQGADIISKLTDKPVNVVCDPVILLEKKHWDDFAANPNIKEPYMLVYFLENNHGRKDFVDELSKRLGLKVVVLTEYLRDIVKPYIKKYGASPEEFVGLFKNASFVYTNSFHGTAFATIYNKPFISVINPDQENAANNNDSRKIDYLTLIGLQDRIVKNELPANDKLIHCDFTVANQKIIEFRKKSLDFLSHSLGE